MLGALALIFALHYSLYAVRARGVKQVPHVTHYVAVLARYVTISYTALVLTPLQMLQCVTIDSTSRERVWFLDGSVSCLQSWQAYALGFVAVMVPLPMVVMWLMVRPWRDETGLGELSRRVRQVLCVGYSTERSFWLGVSLYRRLLLAVAYTQIYDYNWRSMATTSLCVVFVVLNMRYRPLANRLSHRLENVSLMCLAGLSILSGPQMAQLV